MIRITLLLSAALLFGTTVQAQTITAEQLSERLQISATTAEAVVDVLDGIERRPGFLWTAAAELNEQLSPAQIEELLAVRAIAPDGERPRAERQRAPGQRMTAVGRVMNELDDLSAEQREQLHALQQRLVPQMRELAQQARTGEIDRDEQRRLQAGLHRTMMSEALAILTPEQQERARQFMHRLHEDRPRARRGEQRRGQLQMADPERHREAMQTRREARQTALNLTREQHERMEELRQTRHEAVRERNAEAEVERDRRRAMHRPTEARHVREVITDDQRTIMRLHAVLNRALRAQR